MTEAQIVKIKQVSLLLAILIGLTFVIHFFLKWIVGENITPVKNTAITSIPSITKNVDDSAIWMQRMEGKLRDSEKRNIVLEKAFEEQNNKLKEISQEQNRALDEIRIKLDEMSQKSLMTDSDIDLHATAKANEELNNNANVWPPKDEYPSAYPEMVQTSSIYSASLKLTDKNKNLKTKENYIPAGSFVKGIILGGVDASASITSQGEPRPVLLRLVDIGFLPNYARTNIKNCHIIGAAHGDISSERAYIRTERMSCTLNNGKFFESTLEGYVAGEDGKDGVRGKVIRREGDLLWNSFFAGTVAGLGKGMSQSLGTTSISPLGSTTTNVGGDVLKAGALSGVGEGADRLQKYFIERAEQYQPVIQVSAGREVTIVFTKGMSLDGIKT